MPDDKKRPYSNIRKVKITQEFITIYASVAISSSKERMIIKTKGKRAKRRTQDTSLLKCTNQPSFNQNLRFFKSKAPPARFQRSQFESI